MGIVADAVYRAHDLLWIPAPPKLATTAGLVAVVRVWRVFPYDFSNCELDWALLVRWALLVVIVGSVIGLIVSVIALLQISFNPR